MARSSWSTELRSETETKHIEWLFNLAAQSDRQPRPDGYQGGVLYVTHLSRREAFLVDCPGLTDEDVNALEAELPQGFNLTTPGDLIDAVAKRKINYVAGVAPVLDCSLVVPEEQGNLL